MPYPWHCPSSVLSPATKVLRIRKKYYSANVSHMPGLFLLDIHGAPHISSNIMPPKAYVPFSTSSLKLPIGGASYYVRIKPDSRP